MPNIAIIILSLAILVLVLYLANFNFEFRLTAKAKGNNAKSDTTELDRLSNSEVNVLKLVSNGKSNQEIADELFISIHTVKKHVSNIFKKLNLTSRSESRKYKNLIN